jgi:Immunoglobulin domain
MKILMTSLLVCFVTCSALAQGTVNFCNISPGGGVNAPVFLGDGTTKLTGPNYVAQLMAGPTPNTMQLVGQPVPFLTGGGAGYFNGGVVAIPNVPGGTTAYVVVFAWDSTLGGTTTGATEQQAFNYAVAGHAYVWGAYQYTAYGELVPFQVLTGDPSATPPGLPAPLTGLQSFSLGWPGPGGCFYGFTIQPRSQTVVAGAPVTFTVGAAASPPPEWFQWFFQGNLISGATASSYTIPSVQLSDAGAYRASVSSCCWGMHSSDTAILTVLPPPPLITAQPQSRTAEIGSTPFFCVTFTASPPANCQWYFSGNPVANATNPVLLLRDVQPAQTGPYNVVVSNVNGSATSAVADLGVILPVPRRSIPTLVLTGQAGTLVNVDFADAFGTPPNWQRLTTVALTNPPQFQLDLSAPAPPLRFYRAWQTGGLSEPPGLALHMVPGIILTGGIGSSIRLEAINRVGPTDAWFPVATLVLTNTPELYPDVSSIGQPPRLWRVVLSP